MSELQGWLVEWVDWGLAERDITQRQLASEAGISQKHLSEIMNGWQSGSLELWDRLLALGGVRDQALGHPSVPVGAGDPE